MQRPAHARLEQKSKCRAEGGRQEWPERRALRGVEIGRSARNFGLPLETLEQVRRALHRLDRLDVAPARLANAQEDAPLAEGKIGRIEIDRDQFLHAWHSPGPGSQKRVGLDLRGISGSELKLELDLLRFPPRPSSATTNNSVYAIRLQAPARRRPDGAGNIGVLERIRRPTGGPEPTSCCHNQACSRGAWDGAVSSKRACPTAVEQKRERPGTSSR